MSKVSGNTKAAGTLDPNFGDGGVVRPPAGTRSIAVLSDEKVIVVTGDNLQEPITLARLTETGELDPSFGIDGVVKVPVTGYRMLASSVIALENGPYLIFGYESGTAPTRRYVCRLLEDGQLDPSFGDSGMATIRVPDIDVVEIGQDFRFINDQEIDVATDAIFFGDKQIAVSEQHGKIYVSALIYSNAEGYQGVIYRLNDDGSRDTSFNGGYALIKPELRPGLRIMALTPHEDGLLVGGGFTAGDGSPEVAFLKRFDQTGTLDLSFGERGTVVIQNGAEGRRSLITSVAISDSGLIAASGESYKGGAVEGLIAVLNPDGGFNIIFNEGQPLYASFLENLVFSTVVLQLDRKILVTGTGDGGCLMAVRYELDGSLDQTFGNSGWTILHPLEKLTAQSSELTADNKIVVLGKSGFQMYVVRYLG